MLSCNAVNLGAVWTQWKQPGLRSFHCLLGVGSKWGGGVARWAVAPLSAVEAWFLTAAGLLLCCTHCTCLDSAGLTLREG